MKIAKTALFALLPYAIVSVVMYLIGAFVSISWDISQWTFECRVMLVVVNVVFGTALLMRFDNDGCFHT